MRKPLLILAATLLFSCSGDKEPSDEVKALRKEVRELRAQLEQTKSENSQEVLRLRAQLEGKGNESSQEALREFLRIARRTASAMQLGIKYDDFCQKVIELKSLEEEAAPKIADQNKRQRIAEFLTCLYDAQSLWTIKMREKQNYIRLRQLGKDSFETDDYSIRDDRRWRPMFDELRKKYGLDDAMTYRGLSIDEAISRIFHYAAEMFRVVDDRD